MPATDTDFELSLADVAELLGGQVLPEFTDFLLGGGETLTLRQCEDLHHECVRAVLAQHPFLEEPYYKGVFDMEESRRNWLIGQNPDDSHLWFHPVQQEKFVLRRG